MRDIPKPPCAPEEDDHPIKQDKDLLFRRSKIVSTAKKCMSRINRKSIDVIDVSNASAGSR